MVARVLGEVEGEGKRYSATRARTMKEVCAWLPHAQGLSEGCACESCFFRRRSGMAGAMSVVCVYADGCLTEYQTGQR